MAYRRELNYSDESSSNNSTKFSARSFDIAVTTTLLSASDPLEPPTYLLHPILATDAALVQQWNDSLKEVVMKEVRRLPQWNSVVILRRGVSYIAADCVPTIIISISQDRMSFVYEETANRLLGYCRGVNIDVGVIIQESEIHRNVWIRDMTERPGLGASIETSIAVGDKKLGLGAGTLGGYGKLEKLGKAPKVCAMTCHHVVVAADEPSPIREGIMPANWQHSGRLVIHPAMADLQQTLEAANTANAAIQHRLQQTLAMIAGHMASESRISSLPKDEAAAAETAASVQMFLDWTSRLGNVFASSGYKIDAKRECSIDWTLVEMDPGRTGTNAIEQVERFFVPGSDTVIDWKDISLGGIAFKSGRTTGLTTAEFSRIKAQCMMSGNPGETTEAVFTSGSISTPFSKKGDSGSWVLNSDGQLGGLLLAGQEGMSWSYVTPISVVLADIEARLDCTVSLI